MFLKFKDNSETVSQNVEAIADELNLSKWGVARAAFKDIRDILVSGVKENLNGGSFAPLSAATLEYKSRMGYDSRPMHATGNLEAGIDGISGTRYAKAMRGQNEWYAFLHDRGKGYSHWSRNDRVNKAMVSSPRRRTGEPGITKFPARKVFFINAATRNAVLVRYEQLLDTIIERAAKG